MKQPYIYTMPESFMRDGSVPIKWRLYGYINGFWIAGKPVYATNEHFSEKFECSERHISRALAELETEGLLMRDVAGFKRYILPGGMTPDVRGGRRGASAQGDVGGHHISDSISDTLSVRATRVVEETNSPLEGDENPRTSRKTKKVTPEMEAVFEVFVDNPARKAWRLRLVEREAAQVLFDEYGIETLVQRYQYVVNHRGDEFFPEVSSPSEFLQKMNKLEAFVKRNRS
jgi:hypothetical protein